MYVAGVTPSATYAQRLATSRLVHRFNFGPKPGEYVELLKRGVAATQATVLEHGGDDPGITSQAALRLPVLASVFPPPGTAAATAFWKSIYADQGLLESWWLDRMYLSDHPLTERMTLFWHGHWATSIANIFYPLPMQKQNDTFRTYALGNFEDMTKAMVVDGALNYWLDNEENYLTSPNENLARELMELMTLGVNNFTQRDVTAAARALTGYSTDIATGAVRFEPAQHYSKPVTILGTTKPFTAETLATLLVSRPENAKFITDRLWFRFVSGSTTPPPSLKQSFAKRDIASLVDALVHSDAWTSSANSLVKSPVEWFVGACRALRVPPSKPNGPLTQWWLLANGSAALLSPQRRRLALRSSVAQWRLAAVSIRFGPEHRRARRSLTALGSEIEDGAGVCRLAWRSRVVEANRQCARGGDWISRRNWPSRRCSRRNTW